MVDLEGIVSFLFNEHPAYVKMLDAPQIGRDDHMEILNEDFLGKVNRYVFLFLKKLLSEESIVYITSGNVLKHMKAYNEDNSIKIVNVTAAKPIGEAFGRKTIAKLERKQAEK